MQLTRASEYAIRCVLYLAMQPKGSISLLDDISREQQSPRFLCAKVLQALGRQGIVRSTRGTGGGFSLGKPASEISVLDVVECVEGPIILNDSPIDDEDKNDGLVRDGIQTLDKVWQDAQDNLREELGSHKFDELAKKAGMENGGPYK